MQARIAQLKSASLASDSAVQKFKSDHGLISANGKLVSEEHMSELNSQLVTAHSDTVKAEARYNQITEMLRTGQTDGAVTDSLDNPVINDLRQKFLASSKMESELESKLGPDHLQVVNLRRSMAEYRRLILDELKRIAQTYRSEGEVARAKEASLKQSMTSLEDISAGANQTMVELRELEREADTYRNLYESFLQRYQETVQQQSFPVNEARIITSATPPTTPTYPKRLLTIGLCLVLGSVAGAGLGALREYGDRSFRVAAQVRDELGIEFIGMLQTVKKVARNRRKETNVDQAVVAIRDPIYRYSIDHPLSSFSETLRSAKVSVDLSLEDRYPKIVGFISALPGEGKSTVSKNFASLLCT